MFDVRTSGYLQLRYVGGGLDETWDPQLLLRIMNKDNCACAKMPVPQIEYVIIWVCGGQIEMNEGPC